MDTFQIVRRVAGSILLIVLLIYIVATLLDYDAPNFDLPNWATSYAVQLGFVAVMLWCLWPRLEPMPSHQQVNLTPTNQPFMQALHGANVTPEPTPQGAWGNPVEHEGQWVVQGPDGGWYVHANGDWHRYQ